MRLTLRQINEEIERICLETPYDPENEAEIEAQLKALNLKFDEKLENIGYVRIEQKAYIKRLREEKARIDREIANVTQRGDSLDWYCLAEMLRAGLRTFTGKFLKLSIRNRPYPQKYPSTPTPTSPYRGHRPKLCRASHHL